MLLPDCKCCSGFFAVICLLPFSLLLLPPLFPSCPAAVPVVVLSAVSASLALFPFCSHCCSCRCSFCCPGCPGCSCAVPVALPAAFMSLPSPNFPCRPMRPVPPRAAPVPGTQPALGVIRKAAAKLCCSGLVAVTCLLCRIRPGNLTGAGPENLAGVPVRRILHGRP